MMIYYVLKRNILISIQIDRTVYECHHLISREALNTWGDDIVRQKKINCYNEFICDDLDQNWAPSIIMEHNDHVKTLSYYNPRTKTYNQNQQA